MESRVPTMLQEFDATRHHFAAQDHTHQRHDFPIKRSQWWPKDDQGSRCRAIQTTYMCSNHMLRKACAAQPPPQGPITDTSGTSQPPLQQDIPRPKSRDISTANSFRKVITNIEDGIETSSLTM